MIDTLYFRPLGIKWENVEFKSRRITDWVDRGTKSLEKETKSLEKGKTLFLHPRGLRIITKASALFFIYVFFLFEFAK